MSRLSPKYVKQKFHIDWVLVAIMLALFALSISAIYLATPIATLDKLVMKQVLWYVVGLIVLVLILYLDPEIIFTLINYVYWFLMFTLLLLFLARFFNIPFIKPINNAYSWFRFFNNKISFQPSEFMKIALIFKTAQVVTEHNAGKLQYSYAEDIQLFLKIFKFALPPIILIVLEPDTGIPLIMIVSIIAIVAVGGIKNAWVIVGGSVAVGAFAIFIFIFFTNQQLLIDAFGSSYRLARFYGWLETEKYVLSYGNQLYQGLLALGSGGLTGHPLNQAVVYFAEPQNDFIFAVIGQNFGFIGTTLTVILSAALDLKLLSIAYHNDNPKYKLVLMGFLGILVFQQVENMGMITGLLPITGITLPFISYGGSSLLSYMIPLSLAAKMASDNIQKNGNFLK